MLHKARKEDYEALRVVLQIAFDAEEQITFNEIIDGIKGCLLYTIDWFGPYPDDGPGGHFMSKDYRIKLDRICDILKELKAPLDDNTEILRDEVDHLLVEMATFVPEE